MARPFRSPAAVPVIVLALIALIGCARGLSERARSGGGNCRPGL